MLVNVPKVIRFYTDTLERKGMYMKAKAIFDGRMITEFRQIGHSAKKTPDDVDHWDGLANKHEGLRCRSGLDKPLNEEGFLKKMIHGCVLFDGYPETRCMRQKEGIEARHVTWLPVKNIANKPCKIASTRILAMPQLSRHQCRWLRTLIHAK